MTWLGYLRLSDGTWRPLCGGATEAEALERLRAIYPEAQRCDMRALPDDATALPPPEVGHA